MEFWIATAAIFYGFAFLAFLADRDWSAVSRKIDRELSKDSRLFWQ